MYTREQAEAFIQNTLQQFYQQLVKGWDVSPGDRLRFEGKVELLLDMGLLDYEAAISLTEKCYQEAYSEPVNPDFWKWLEEEKSYQMPYKMMEAPVYRGGSHEA